MIVSKISIEELHDLHPPLPDELFELNKKLSEKIYDITKNYYPAHIKKIAKFATQYSISSNEMKIEVLNHLLEVGVLKPLTDVQKKTVNMILFLGDRG